MQCIPRACNPEGYHPVSVSTLQPEGDLVQLYKSMQHESDSLGMLAPVQPYFSSYRKLLRATGFPANTKTTSSKLHAQNRV